jgi:hypothetical protein
MGRHGEPCQPHGIGRHAGHDPGNAPGLRKAEGEFVFEARGTIEIKGKGGVEAC